MLIVVTGAGGFIGSTLTDVLLARGHRVVGIDCFTNYYEPRVKRANLESVMAHSGFELVEADLREATLAPVLDGADVVFHEAAQPGVRLSWSTGFPEYASCNVLATQRLLEAARETSPSRFVYASSSSVYGNAPTYPSSEGDLPQPFSPYGVTKLAGEHLCSLYATNWGVPTISLRYFTVYGPRQRPDMAMHRLCEAALEGKEFSMFGDGQQRRDFTFVDDVVRANLACLNADAPPGTVLNIASGAPVELRALIAMVGAVHGTPIAVSEEPSQTGDVRETAGRIERAHAVLGWEPTTTLREGVEAQLGWHAARLDRADHEMTTDATRGPSPA